MIYKDKNDLNETFLIVYEVHFRTFNIVVLKYIKGYLMIVLICLFQI